jgi:very-short-patch-repair endonuclease
MFTMQARNLAQAMRAQPTSNEALLWSRLRNRKLAGLKFRRQVPIEGYIADFLCIEARLIVEADGPTHVGSAYDEERDRQLEAMGYRVLRFPNARIWNQIDAVLADIQSAAGRQGPF